MTAGNGLLSSLRGPRGHTSVFAYDSIGRLVSDSGPDGGVARLTTVRSDSVGEVTYQTALGRTTTYRIEGITTGGERRITTDPAGLVTTRVTDLAGRTTTALATGDSMWTVSGPDPRFGMEAPRAESLTVKTPARLRATVKERKRVTRSNPNDPLSLATRIDSASLNGQWTVSTYTAATRRAVTTSPLRCP